MKNQKFIKSLIYLIP